MDNEPVVIEKHWGGNDPSALGIFHKPLCSPSFYKSASTYFLDTPNEEFYLKLTIAILLTVSLQGLGVHVTCDFKYVC